MIAFEEDWKIIPEFPDYKISNYGRVYNIHRGHEMRTSLNNFGHMKISLLSLRDGQRYTRSVAQMVAEAFLEPYNFLCDHVLVKDGDFAHVSAENLTWRPRWFVWKYSHQLKTEQPLHYHNLQVVNVLTGDKYNSIIEAGIMEGLLFDDIWKSTYTRETFFPNIAIFEVIR